MHIRILSVSKTREGYLREGEQEYLKRFRSGAKVLIEEIGSSKGVQGSAEQVIETEARMIEAKLRDGEYLVVLDPRGKQFTSVAFAEFLNEKRISGSSAFCFVVGGAFGVSESLRQRADLLLSLSQMTLPHQLCRLFVVEQLYRAYSILEGGPYHK